MNLSNIKKIVLEEGKVVIIDGEDALVVMNFDEYKKIKGLPREERKVELAKPVIELAQPVILAEPEKPLTELTLDDLPF